MAGFFDKCLDAAVAQNAISKKEADYIKGLYEDHYKAASGAGDLDPAATAKGATAKVYETMAAQKRRAAELALDARDAISAYQDSYRSPSYAGFGPEKPDIVGANLNLLHNLGGYAKTSSVAGTAGSKYGLLTARLADLVNQFSKSKLTGMRLNPAGAKDMVHEVYGTSRSPEAKAMADAVNMVNKEAREDFNRAGGNVKELEGPWLPQDHDPVKALSAGREEWLSDHKNWLDLDRMRDPISGIPLSAAKPERLNALLNSAYGHITTNGWSDRKPSTQPIGIGPTYLQRQEHRFLHYKTADDWMAANQKYGSGDPVAAVFKHLRSISADTAAMEILGPHPDATLEWMSQVQKSEAAKFIEGKPSLYRGGSGTKAKIKAQDSIEGTVFQDRLRAVYDNIVGGATSSGRIARFLGDVRNVLTSAQLGSTVLTAAPQDPMIDIAARHFSGIPNAIGGIVKGFSSEARDKVVRAGFITDEFMHVLGTEARYAGVLGGHNPTKWLAERTVTWSGLEPMTQARKTKFQLDYMAAVADRRNMSFDEIGNEMPNFRRTFEAYGLTEKDWDKIRAVEPHVPGDGSAPIQRPIDVADTDRRLGERYLEVMLQQTERDVPSSNPRAAAIATLGLKRGTIPGELARSVMQYKAFSLSMMGAQWDAMMIQARGGSLGGAAASGAGMVARGAAYAAPLLIGLTFAGAASLQLKNLVNGKDIEDMGNLGFWIRAMQAGGGFGLLGDFILSDQNRFGQTPLESLLGPTFGAAADMTKLVIGDTRKSVNGDKVHVGRDLVNIGLGRYTPVLSSFFATRAAYRRMVLDQLQFLVDPEAHQRFRQAEQTLHRQTGQGFFWHPGETLPARMPEMSAAKP